MDLRITTTYGQIGIRTYQGRISIEQTKPEALIEQPRADLSIETEISKPMVDNSQCFAESGLKPVLMLAHEFYEESFNRGLEAIGEMADEGWRLMAIEHGGNPIAEIATERTLKERELVMVSMPQSRPKIEWTPGYVNIEFKQNQPRVNWNINNRARIDAEKSRVEVFMERYPSIKIEYVGNTIDRQI